jgi:hypothetical protein
MKKLMAWVVLNFVLFFVLSPGNFVVLPEGGSRRVVAATHAALFVLAHVVISRVLHKSL